MLATKPYHIHFRSIDYYFVIYYQSGEYDSILPIALDFGEHFQSAEIISDIKQFTIDFFRGKNLEIEFVNIMV